MDQISRRRSPPPPSDETPAAAGRGKARDRLLAAAAELFSQAGYLPVTVEDIAAAAGVSRVTFYRQFAGKEAITAELFDAMADRATPRLTAIGRLDYRDRASPRAWIAAIFAADQTHPALLRAFTQALVAAPDFLLQARRLTDRVIAALGATIPAFAADPGDPAQRRQWTEAWLLLYEIMDQSNHAALGLCVAEQSLMIDILTDRFLAFVTHDWAA